jgi:hypothetical protein
MPFNGCFLKQRMRVTEHANYLADHGKKTTTHQTSGKKDSSSNRHNQQNATDESDWEPHEQSDESEYASSGIYCVV